MVNLHGARPDVSKLDALALKRKPREMEYWNGGMAERGPEGGGYFPPDSSGRSALTCASIAALARVASPANSAAIF